VIAGEPAVPALPVCRFRVPWAQLLLACCQCLAAMDDQAWALPLALELAGWNLGVLRNLRELAASIGDAGR
jgi:hypothetical protein